MADGTKIEWTDATWNPITGCSVVSPGCTNCYAMKLAGTRLKHHPSRKGLTIDTKAGPVWNGQVRLNSEWLYQPASWKKPRMIFVCAHGDLFHPDVPDGWIMQVLNVMAQCPQHVFQVLTKRSDRMRNFFTRWASIDGEDFADFKDARGPEEVRVAHPSPRGQLFAAMLESMGEPPPGRTYPAFDWAGGMMQWPEILPNVWLGVSAEDQLRANERIPDLLETPAAVRWISGEPVIGDIDLQNICFMQGDAEIRYDVLAGEAWVENSSSASAYDCGLPTLDWVVAGGESGAGARPMHPDWARKIRDQCADAGVPFLFKQWGNWRQWNDVASGFQNCSRFDRLGNVTEARARLHPPYRNGFTQPEGDFPWHGNFLRFEKAVAGRLLDGVEHNAFPPFQTQFTEARR